MITFYEKSREIRSRLQPLRQVAVFLHLGQTRSPDHSLENNCRQSKHRLVLRPLSCFVWDISRFTRIVLIRAEPPGPSSIHITIPVCPTRNSAIWLKYDEKHRLQPFQVRRDRVLISNTNRAYLRRFKRLRSHLKVVMLAGGSSAWFTNLRSAVKRHSPPRVRSGKACPGPKAGVATGFPGCALIGGDHAVGLIHINDRHEFA